MIHFCAMHGLVGQGHFWIGQDADLQAYGKYRKDMFDTEKRRADYLTGDRYYNAQRRFPYLLHVAIDGFTFTKSAAGGSIDKLFNFFVALQKRSHEVFGDTARYIP